MNTTFNWMVDYAYAKEICEGTWDFGYPMF